MPALPAGTVTFLFTDIEGSTRLWERHPEAMKVALARHDAILREAIEADGGAVFKTVGDAFCAAFDTAPQAVAAAVAAQRVLQAEAWGEAGPLRVRMALHTGAAEARQGDYFGPPLNRVARLLGAGHGGQVLLSAATQELVRDGLPAAVELRDLGEHRLKDLGRPEHVFQLAAAGLPTDFPPLRTLETHPNNLPIQPTPLIGREREVGVVTELLRGDVRLATLTGPGGTGKTRLALQVGADLLDRFGDGVFFIALAPISDPDLVAPTIAQTLGVRESGDRSLRESLIVALREAHLLLVLDNFEQVLSAAPLVADLLAACAHLKMLVTSRAALRLRGEQEFAVPPLGLPERAQRLDVATLPQYDAVRLFIERARAVSPDFGVTNANAPAVAEICHRLEGLPLAIELAAARIRLLPPQAMLARLEHRLKLLTGGARDLPARQQTLRDAIAWSYDLLDPAEQRLFRRLSVFVGGCPLAAAEAVARGQRSGDGQREPTPSASSQPLVPLEGEVLDLMESLVSKSLLQQKEGADGEPRFTLLESIREYGLEQLAASGEERALQRRHASVYLAFAERAKRELSGPQQGAWLARLEAEHGNLRAGFRTWEAQADAERALRLVEALHWFWIVRGHLTEGREQAVRVVRLAATEQPASRARALAVGATLAFNQSDYGAARALWEATLEIWRALGDTASLPGTLMDLAATAVTQGDHAAARAYLEESLAVARQAGDRFVVSRSVNDLANLAHEQGDYARARSLYEEAQTMARENNDLIGVATVLNNLAVVARDQGDVAAARALLEESLAVRQAHGDQRGIALTLTNLADLLSQQGDHDRAHACLVESLVIEQALGAAPGIALVLERFAGLAAAQARAARALRLAGAATALRASVGAVASPAARALLEQRLSSARQALGEDAATLAWTEGQALSLDQTIAYALETTDGP